MTQTISPKTEQPPSSSSPPSPSPSPSSEGPWKNLTNDILALILKRLNTNSDLCRFRSICKSWRSFATPKNPHLTFPLSLPPLHPTSRPFSLSPTLIYLFSPPPSSVGPPTNVWLTKVSETGDNKWALLNPLTKHKLYFFSSGVFQNGFNLMGFRYLEVGRSYRLQLINHHHQDDTFDFQEFSSSISVRKVVVNLKEEGISVLGLYGYGQIAVWNSNDDHWKIIETKKNDFDDIICYYAKFYAVDKKGRLVMINDTSFEVEEVISANDECNGIGQYSYLVKCNYGLYLVNKIVNPRPTNYYDEEEEEWVVDRTSVGKPLGFKVFVLNMREKRWERVRSLGNSVVFVSRDATFSIRAEELGWSKGNCVYFEGLTGYDDEADMTFGLNAGVYTLEDDGITTFGTSVDRWTAIFWPPSSWFVQDEEYPECEMQD